MPYKIQKRGNKFVVVKETTGEKVAEHSTMEKAQSQVRLLQAVEHGWKPGKRK